MIDLQTTNTMKTCTTTPAVAIGMPVYNGAKYIRNALDSLLAQTYADFELIISDNASTDDTEAICLEYTARDARIRYSRQASNIGSSSNFRFVLEQARGRYFMWAAADDFWAPNWLETLTQEIAPDDFGVRGRVVIVEEDGDLLGDLPVKPFRAGDVARVFLDDEKNGRAFHIYGLLNRRLALDLFPLIERSPMDDYGPDILFVYLAVQKGALRVTHRTAQYYRRHQSNTGSSLARKFLGIRRILYRAHPWFFYSAHVSHAPSGKWGIIVCLIPVKYVKTQLELWYRGLRFLVTGRRVL